MKQELISVEVIVKNTTKTCSTCQQTKQLDKDFYLCQGRYRSDCKACTIRKNVRHQKKIKAWKHRFVDADQQRTYMVDYYSKNKEKFAEYRRKFRERYPDYYREYARKRKNEIK